MPVNNFPPLYLERAYAGSANSLFDAWTMPAVAELWLFQSGKNEVDLVADVREGGEFHTVEKKQPHAVSHTGNYITINRPDRLVFSLAVPDHFEGVSEVSVEIKESQGGCHLTFTQKNVDTSKNAEPWRTMLGQIHDLLKAPYIITETSDQKDILTAVSVVGMQIAGFVLPMSEDQINGVPYKNSWTAARLIRHIIMSITCMTEALGIKGKPADREIAARIIELKHTFLDITIAMQSPEEIVPEQKNYDKDVLIRELQDCLKQFRETASKVEASELVEGLPLGPVTKLEMIHFVLYHTQRHLYQMKRIADAIQHQES